eukprot:scaffold156258_cov33-Tisochrysis_lutea.AAC.3
MLRRRRIWHTSQDGSSCTCATATRIDEGRHQFGGSMSISDSSQYALSLKSHSHSSPTSSVKSSARFEQIWLNRQTSRKKMLSVAYPFWPLQSMGLQPLHCPNRGECRKSRLFGALEKMILRSPCPGILPYAAHTCHSKLRQMLYGTRSP